MATRKSNEQQCRHTHVLKMESNWCSGGGGGGGRDTAPLSRVTTLSDGRSKTDKTAAASYC